jgi:hypothetical protein
MRNAIVWTIVVAAAMAVPALGGGARTPAASNRNSVANRTRNVLPAMPIGGGSGRMIQLGDSYSVLDTLSIFNANRGVPTTRTTGGGGPPPPPPAPVFRASFFDEIGPLALMEIPDGRSGTTVEYLREGQTFSWDGSKVLNITPDILFLSRTSSAGGVTETEVVIGRDLNGKQIGAVPTVPGYVSQDMAGPARNPGTGVPGRGRGRSGPGGARGAFTGNALFGPGNTGGVTGVPAGVSLDPPLPPGSADDMANRMAQRRQIQLGALTEPASLPATANFR